MLTQLLALLSIAVIALGSAEASEIRISRKDVDHLLAKNLEIVNKTTEYKLTCNIERMGRHVGFNGGCRYFDIFANFINKNSNGKFNIAMDFELRQSSLSILFAPDDFMTFPQYSSTTKILKSCDLIKVDNNGRGARFIRVGPDGKHAMRCLTLGLLRDMGITITHPESDPMSKDYVAFYHFLVGPYSDFEQSVAYVREALKKDDLTIVIED